MLSVEELQRRLQWQHVDEEVNDEYGLVYLFIRPNDSALEPVYFCLDSDRSSIVQFGFGEWHYHPEEIDDGVETASQIVQKMRCVIEQCDANGKYRGGGLHAPDAFPDTLGKEIKSLRRVFFDSVPVSEPIDFSRYIEGKYLWVSHEKQAETERVYRELGMPVPEF